MKTWEEFRRQGRNEPLGLVKLDIACPRCKEETPIYRHNDIALVTYPLQFRYECLKCGWHDYL